MSRRPVHKTAHLSCPYGQDNWADCDAAASHRWGRCVALVDAKAGPHTCTNWAVAEDGWCGQHYISLHEKQMRKAREAARQLQLAERIDAFLLKSSDPDWKWWESLGTSESSTRGLHAPSLPRRRGVPHRIG